MGIASERLELIGRTQTPEEHLGLYANIDIALDTFPYNGTTTTCEAMWMGVPVITRSENAHAGRVGASLLNAVGHPEWVSRQDGDFLRITKKLAADINGLKHIRAKLRQEMRVSGLCDAERFAARFTQMLRLLWKDYCAANVAPR
jgi:predicted O-linked N-acetylglucosamine transferase (SPINDLY family)